MEVDYRVFDGTDSIEGSLTLLVESVLDAPTLASRGIITVSENSKTPLGGNVVDIHSPDSRAVELQLEAGTLLVCFSPKIVES